MSPSKLHANLAAGLPVLYVGPRGQQRRRGDRRRRRAAPASGRATSTASSPRCAACATTPAHEPAPAGPSSSTTATRPRSPVGRHHRHVTPLLRCTHAPCDWRDSSRQPGRAWCGSRRRCARGRRAGRSSGSQPSSSRALVMSGWRCVGSSTGRGSNTISLDDPVTSMASSASSRIVNSCPGCRCSPGE